LTISSFALHRSRTNFAAARVRILLRQDAGRDQVDDGGGMFHLLPKGRTPLNSPFDGAKSNLSAGNRFGQRDYLPLDAG